MTLNRRTFIGSVAAAAVGANAAGGETPANWPTGLQTGEYVVDLTNVPIRHVKKLSDCHGRLNDSTLFSCPPKTIQLISWKITTDPLTTATILHDPTGRRWQMIEMPSQRVYDLYGTADLSWLERGVLCHSDGFREMWASASP